MEEVKLLKRLRSSAEPTECNEEDEADYTLGMYQSIGEGGPGPELVSLSTGYREFDRYIDLQGTAESQNVYELAVESMKRSTRKYAKRQVSWIKNKLIPAVLRVNEGSSAGRITPFYLLDATSWCMFLSQFERLTGEV